MMYYSKYKLIITLSSSSSHSQVLLQILKNQQLFPLVEDFVLFLEMILKQIYTIVHRMNLLIKLINIMQL